MAERRAKSLLTLPALGAALGFTAAVVFDTGCISPDYCIKVVSSGKRNCLYLEGAEMWPVGEPENAEPVPSSLGAPGPAGCVCYNSAEQEIIDFGVPQPEYDAFHDEIEDAARDACDVLVPAGYDHNCYLTAQNPATVGGNGNIFPDGLGECVGSCSYINPPREGSCPDPNPYECEGGSGETGTDGGDDGTEGGLGAGDYITCVRNDCDIDSDFAQHLYDNLDLLLEEGTTLEYDSSASRFVFVGVTSNSLAGELGFVSGDKLELVNSVTIDDLDAALATLAEADEHTTFDVRVQRGTQWVDFTFTLD